jgi:hypothetical protein
MVNVFPTLASTIIPSNPIGLNIAFPSLPVEFESDNTPIDERKPPFPLPLFHPSSSTSPNHNRIKKGQGPESRRNAPDLYDDYRYQTESHAYARLLELGYPNLSVTRLIQLSNKLEDILLFKNVPLTLRKRAAKRRKPNAYHWLDENWVQIEPIFDDWFEIMESCSNRKEIRRMRSLPAPISWSEIQTK